MEKQAVATIKSLRADVDPSVSTFQIQKSNVGKVAPDTPPPEIWSQAIDKTGTTGAVDLENKRIEKDRAYNEKMWATIIPPPTSEKRKANGGDH